MSHVHIPIDDIYDDHLWCTRHQCPVTYKPYSEATSPLNLAKSECPGLAAQVGGEPTLNPEHPDFLEHSYEYAEELCYGSWVYILSVELSQLTLGVQ